MFKVNELVKVNGEFCRIIDIINCDNSFDEVELDNGDIVSSEQLNKLTEEDIEKHSKPCLCGKFYLVEDNKVQFSPMLAWCECCISSVPVNLSDPICINDDEPFMLKLPS
jgi:hypothetical protein